MFKSYTELVSAWEAQVSSYVEGWDGGNEPARGPAKGTVLELWSEKFVKPAIILLAQSAELNRIEQELGYSPLCTCICINVSYSIDANVMPETPRGELEVERKWREKIFADRIKFNNEIIAATEPVFPGRIYLQTVFIFL